MPNDQLQEEVVKTEKLEKEERKERMQEGRVGKGTTFRERRSNKLPKSQT
jgi:hypothetical protein